MKPPSEKRISSQHELICIQANIIALEMQARIRRGRFVQDTDDLDGFMSGINVFRSELETLRHYIEGAQP